MLLGVMPSECGSIENPRREHGHLQVAGRARNRVPGALGLVSCPCVSPHATFHSKQAGCSEEECGQHDHQ